MGTASDGVGIVAQQDDGQVPSGQGFLRAMSAQNERARAFDRRMRWFWMRWQLTDPAQAGGSEETTRADVPGPGHRPAADPENIVLPAVTPSEVRAVPVQRS